MQLDQTLHQRQADAQATLRAIHAGIDLREQIEHMGHLLRRNADAVVAHMDQHIRFITLDLDVDPAIRVSVFGGIREQVFHNLNQPVTVSIDWNGLLRQVHAQLLVLALDHGPHRLDRIEHLLAQHQTLAAQLDLALGDARDIEQVIDQSGHVPQLALAHGHCLPGSGFRLHSPAQQTDRIANRRQRIAQLVRQHRQELILAPVSLLQCECRRLACTGRRVQAVAGRLECCVHRRNFGNRRAAMRNPAALRQGVRIGSNRIDCRRHSLPNDQAHENAQAEDCRTGHRHARNRLTQRFIANRTGLTDHHRPPDRHPLPGSDHRAPVHRRNPDRTLLRAVEQSTAQFASQQRVEVALQIGGSGNDQHLAVDHQCRRTLLQPTGDHPRETLGVESAIQDPPNHAVTQHRHRDRDPERPVRGSINV